MLLSQSPGCPGCFSRGPQREPWAPSWNGLQRATQSLSGASEVSLGKPAAGPSSPPHSEQTPARPVGSIHKGIWRTDPIRSTRRKGAKGTISPHPSWYVKSPMNEVTG